jgi:hypothetical protein
MNLSFIRCKIFVLGSEQFGATVPVSTLTPRHPDERRGRENTVAQPAETCIRCNSRGLRHYTSRAGDPHRHLHLQINARVFAAGTWRGLHSVGARDYLEAVNGIGHAAVTTDPGFRRALAERGLTLDPASGELVELASYVPGFSARAAQIGRNLERFEAAWRAEHPGQEPGPRLRQAWDRRAWAQARPDKMVPKDGAAMVAARNEELRRLGYRDPARPVPLSSPTVGSLDRDQAVELVVSRLGVRRSAWNAADIRGQVEHWIAQTGLVADATVRIELAEDLTARAVTACTPLLDRDDVPEHVRALNSPRVMAVEDRIGRLLGLQAYAGGHDTRLDARTALGLDPAQQCGRGARRDQASPRCRGRGRSREDHHAGRNEGRARGAGASDAGGHADVEGRRGRRRGDRRARVLSGVAGPSVGLAVGRRRPLGVHGRPARRSACRARSRRPPSDR